jgi:hypothetical protein
MQKVVLQRWHRVGFDLWPKILSWIVFAACVLEEASEALAKPRKVDVDEFVYRSDV